MWQLFLVTHPVVQTHQQGGWLLEVENSWFQNQHCLLTFTFNAETNIQVKFSYAQLLHSVYATVSEFLLVTPLPVEYYGGYTVPVLGITLNYPCLLNSNT